MHSLPGFLVSTALEEELVPSPPADGKSVDHGKKSKLEFSIYPGPQVSMLQLSPTTPASLPTPPSSTLIVPPW